MFRKTASLLHLPTPQHALHYYCTHICLTAIKKKVFEPNPTNLNPSSLDNGNNDRSHSERVFIRYNENGIDRIVQCTRAPVKMILLDMIKKTITTIYVLVIIGLFKQNGPRDTSELECVPTCAGSIRIATIPRRCPDNP